MISPAPDRLKILEEHGRAYGTLRLAIGWTDGLDGEAAKRSRHWQSRPDRLADAEHGAGLFRRGLTRNPVVSLRASGLVGVDLDGEAGVALSRNLVSSGWPLTVAVRTGRGVHLWFRPPYAQAPAKIEFSADGLELSRDGYLVAPPGLHPSGAVYAFAEGRAPWEVELAILPVALLEELTAKRRSFDEAERADDASPIPEGGRHRHLRRIAGAMRRAGARRAAVEAALLVENRERCSPPKDEALVRALAEDMCRRYPPGART